MNPVMIHGVTPDINPNVTMTIIMIMMMMMMMMILMMTTWNATIWGTTITRAADFGSGDPIGCWGPAIWELESGKL